jgi:RNA polymerase sigma-70 factor, ECF subfamily
MITDMEGVERLRAHDALAFRALIDRLQQPITGYLHRLVGDREVALDLAQDTFVQVYATIEKTSGELALDAWIYRIATSYGLRYLKRKHLRPCVSLEECESCDDRPVTAGPEEHIEISMLIQQALGTLKPVDAAVLQLHFGDGFTYEEIGAVLRMSSEAVRKRVTYGAEKFRRIYGRHGSHGRSLPDKNTTEAPSRRTFRRSDRRSDSPGPRA